MNTHGTLLGKNRECHSARLQPARLPRRPQYNKSTHISGRRALTPVAAGPEVTNVVTRLSKAVLRSAAAVAAALVVSLPASAAEIRLPISNDPEIFAQQATLAEAWSLINETFYDGSFNSLDWTRDLEKHMRASFFANDKEEAYSEIASMVQDLNDPYTRVVPASQYDDFRDSTEGQVHGVGLMLASDPNSKRLTVLTPLRHSPAERAGVKAGDQVVKIDGISVQDWDAEDAGQLLRGKKGTNVQLQVSRTSEYVPGVARRPELLDAPRQLVVKNVTMRRDLVTISPVYATKLGAPSKPQMGYIRLASFSANSPRDVRKAMLNLSLEGAKGFILDLRDNPGGLVTAGMDIARLWLDGDATVFNVAGRDADATQRIQLTSGRAASDDPLVVLVNGGSASASEILAGALRDYGRATIVGDSHTYGKGKIQSLFELNDGSALFVTVAKYKTPKFMEIDHVGISPDVKCSLPDTTSNAVGPQLYGYGVGVNGAMAFSDQLAQDPCFLAAEQTLTQQMLTLAPERTSPLLRHGAALRLPIAASTVIRHR